MDHPTRAYYYFLYPPLRTSAMHTHGNNERYGVDTFQNEPWRHDLLQDVALFTDKSNSCLNSVTTDQSIYWLFYLLDCK